MFNHGNGGKWDDDPNDSRMCVKLSDSCSRSMARFRTREWRVTVSASSHDHFHKKDDSIIVGFGWIWAMLPYFFSGSYRQMIIYFIYTHIFMHLLAVFLLFFHEQKLRSKPSFFLGRGFRTFAAALRRPRRWQQLRWGRDTWGFHLWWVIYGHKMTRAALKTDLQ